jgi:hypothetical protein
MSGGTVANTDWAGVSVAGEMAEVDFLKISTASYACLWSVLRRGFQMHILKLTEHYGQGVFWGP